MSIYDKRRKLNRLLKDIEDVHYDVARNLNQKELDMLTRKAQSLYKSLAEIQEDIG